MEFLKTLLSEETLKTLNESLGEELVKSINEKTKGFKIDVAKEKFIPKVKFDEVNDSLKDYKVQIEDRDKQLKDLQEKAKGNEELTKQIEELQTANETTRTEYEAKILAREKDFAIENYLLAQGSKNTKAVKANLDLEKVSFEDAKLLGLEEQVKNLKESDSYLFNVDVSKDGIGKSTKSGERLSKDEFADFRKLR